MDQIIVTEPEESSSDHRPSDGDGSTTNGNGGFAKVSKGLSLSLIPPSESDESLGKSGSSNGHSVWGEGQKNGNGGGGDVCQLTEAEEQATRDFLENVNGARAAEGISPLSWNAAVKFLMARKFNARRALELYEQHQKIRVEEDLIEFDPNAEPLRSELLSQKFTVLPTRDLGGAAIAVFTARYHNPNSGVSHEQNLKGVVYQLDAALEDPQTQRCGLVFVYDMSDSKYQHFDYDLSIKMLTLLKGGYPARLKKVLIVTAPLWFRAPFKILRLFVREKLRDRVFTVSVPQLGVHIPNSSLPKTLGGQLEVNHKEWLQRCHYVLSSTDLWGCYSESQAKMDASSSVFAKPANGRKGHSSPSPLPNSSGSSGFSDDDSLPYDERGGLTLQKFVEHLKQKGRRGLLDEYNEIVSKTPEGSFSVSKLRVNVCKNRYSDVLCFDHSRVTLSSGTSSNDPSDENDYINANFVDGYKQKHAFISTQGPLKSTYGDFWRMIWEQMCVLIVMTTKTTERGRTKCGQYWPLEQDASYDEFEVTNLGIETRPEVEITRLRVTNLNTNQMRTVTHMQFLAWPDYGVPSSPAAMLNFLVAMREEQRKGVEELGNQWDGHSLGPPIVAHCSAGIGRTGTLITMDICIRRHQDQGTVDVQATVERIRGQRAYSIQVPEQYLFCHAAMVEYGKSHGLLDEQQLEGLPDLLAEDYNSPFG